MSDTTLETGVDKLVSILKEKKFVSLKDLAKEINLSEEILETWANFLMEDGIISIEYKFTTPYLRYVKKEEKKEEVKKKDIFSDEKGNTRTEYHWKEEMFNTLETKNSFFIDEAKKRGLTDINSLWDEYKEKISNEF